MARLELSCKQMEGKSAAWRWVENEMEAALRPARKERPRPSAIGTPMNMMRDIVPGVLNDVVEFAQRTPITLRLLEHEQASSF